MIIDNIPVLFRDFLLLLKRTESSRHWDCPELRLFVSLFASCAATTTFGILLYRLRLYCGIVHSCWKGGGSAQKSKPTFVESGCGYSSRIYPNQFTKWTRLTNHSSTRTRTGVILNVDNYPHCWKVNLRTHLDFHVGRHSFDDIQIIYFIICGLLFYCYWFGSVACARAERNVGWRESTCYVEVTSYWSRLSRIYVIWRI